MSPRQLTLPVTPRESFDLDLFFAGRNTEALAAVQRTATGQHPRLLLLHGPTGSGRTHLLQGAVRAASAGGRSAAYVALASAEVPAVLEGLEQCDLVCVDDIDAHSAQREWALALLRLLDGLRMCGGAAVLTAAQLPENIPSALPDLTTRLSACAVYALKPLDDLERRALLQHRARARALDLTDEVADFLVRRLPRDGGSLMRALMLLDQASLTEQRRLTLPFVQSQLAVLLPSNARTTEG